MFLWGEKVEGEKCISAQGSSVKGGRQQSSTTGPKVKGWGPLFSGRGPLNMGGLVNDTTPAVFVLYIISTLWVSEHGPYLFVHYLLSEVHTLNIISFFKKMNKINTIFYVDLGLIEMLCRW